MAKKKTTRKSRAKEPNAAREFVGRAGEVFRNVTATMLAEHTWRVIGSVAIVGVLTAWAVARGPLMEKIAQNTADPVSVSIGWPSADGEGTWLPASVQDELERIALSTLTMDPFDHEALAQTATELEKTGWLSKVNSVRRETDGLVRIEGAWRAHAAVVVKEGEQFLVGAGAEVLKVPLGGMDTSMMYVIREPRVDVPTLPDGSIAYGESWIGAVDEAIALLRSIDGVPGSARIAGIDLADFSRDVRLVLFTTGGSRIVWGSAIGDESPGEASTEQKMANLRGILANGDDTRHRVLEIVLPQVEIDVRSNR